MTLSDTENPYILLAAFLAPHKSREQIDRLRALIADEPVDWAQLVYLANVELCTPLWYVQLRRDGLLELLPQELQEYLEYLHAANSERNEDLRLGLIEFLTACAGEWMTPVLLKGAATFCDDLYGAPGARIMGDLDLLFEWSEVDAARALLMRLGYEEIPDPGMEFDGIATDERHHQLPRYHKPDTPLVIEIHFKVSYGQAGRVLPVTEARLNTRRASLDGTDVLILNPQWRLRHNTVHALLPHCEFIRGAISLLQLNEFVRLAQHYKEQIDWQQWFAPAAAHGLSEQYNLYRRLASELQGLITTEAAPASLRQRFHRRRVLAVGRGKAVQPEAVRPPGAQFYYYLNLPLWVWRNICYINGIEKLPLRLYYLFKKILSARSRSRIGM